MSRFIRLLLLAASVLSFAAPARAVSYQLVTPGVWHHFERRITKAGPMAINVLMVDPKRADVRSVMATRPGGGFGRAAVSTIAKEAGAVAAINGSFFSWQSNEPASLLVVNGQIVSSSRLNRSVFGIRYDGRPFIADARVLASVLLDDGEQLNIDRVNHAAANNAVTLFSPPFGHETRTTVEPWRYEAAIDQTGTVIAVSNGDMPIPPNGYVVSGEGRFYHTLATELRLGDRALVFTRLQGMWEGVRYAVGGGPTIVKDGRVYVNAKEEGFSAAIAKGRSPRTAIGYTRDGRTLLVTVDGRNPKYSVGCTLFELARLMRELGAVQAINLDGGGSSTMVIGGKLVNHVSAGKERLVSNAIGVFPKE